MATKIPILLLTTSNTVDERLGIQVCKSSKHKELRKRIPNKAMPFVLVNKVIRSKMVNRKKQPLCMIISNCQVYVKPKYFSGWKFGNSFTKMVQIMILAKANHHLLCVLLLVAGNVTVIINLF